jgi:hypothetical protein
MNRIDEDKLNELHKTMRDVVGEDCVIVTLKNWNKEVDEHKRLLSKLEIAEKVLEQLEQANILLEVNVDEIISAAKFTTGTEIMINEANKNLLEKGNKAKRLAREALQQLRT